MWNEQLPHRVLRCGDLRGSHSGLCDFNPTPGGGAGSPCQVKADCTIGGVFGACNVGSSWPGGYCQDTCLVLNCNGTEVCLSQNCWERCPGPRTGQNSQGYCT